MELPVEGSNNISSYVIGTSSILICAVVYSFFYSLTIIINQAS